MIISNARSVLEKAQLRRTVGLCCEMAVQVVKKASGYTGIDLKLDCLLLENRNSACFKVLGGGLANILKINKNPGSGEVFRSVQRMEQLSSGLTVAKFSMPSVLYVDKQTDAVIMEFIDGFRLDLLLASQYRCDDLNQYIVKAAHSLSALHTVKSGLPEAARLDTNRVEIEQLADIFPNFIERHYRSLESLAELDESSGAVIHGDFSPKNLIYSVSGGLFFLDLTSDSLKGSPLRDLAVFKVGVARSLFSHRNLGFFNRTSRGEAFFEMFLLAYLDAVGLTISQKNMYKNVLSLYELVRLGEMKIWLDGYEQFGERFRGRFKSVVGNYFVRERLAELGKKLS